MHKTTGIAVVSMALLMAACAKKEEPAPAPEAPAPEAAAPEAAPPAESMGSGTTTAPAAEGASSSTDAAQSGGDKVSQ